MKKVKFQSAEVSEALAVLGKVATSKAEIPILECVRLEIGGAGMKLEASDATTHVSTCVPCECLGESFVIAVRHAWLANVCNTGGDATVYLEAHDSGTLTARCGHSETHGAQQDSGAFPDAPKIESEWAPTKFTYSGGALRRALKCAEVALEKSGIRPAMQHAYVTTDAEGVTRVVGTDGRLLCLKEGRMLAAPRQDDSVDNFLLPPVVINLLGAIPGRAVEITRYTRIIEPEAKEGEAARTTAKPIDFVDIYAGGYEIKTRVDMSLRYPDFIGVIDAGTPLVATVGKDSLLKALDRVNKFGDAATGIFELEMNGGRLVVSSRDPDMFTGHWVEVPCIAGDGRADLCVCYTYSIMAKAIKTIQGGTLNLHIGGIGYLALRGEDETQLALVIPIGKAKETGQE